MTLPLLDITARYATPQKKTTKEFCSACPFCGGNDRFIIQPYGSRQDDTPHAFCRQCKWRGTAINLLQDKEQISYWDARAIIDGSKNIDEVSTTMPRQAGRDVKTTKAEIDGAPCQEWQWAGKAFCRVCKSALWSEAGTKALQWLRDRGLSDESIDAHDFGYNARDWYVERPQDWGISEKLWLPRGIVLPYVGKGQLWKIEIRRSTNQKKDRYWSVKGSANALYGYADLAFNGKAVMCEGVFDAVAMKQALSEAGVSEVAVVATGSTNGSYEDRWVMRLALCEKVVVAFDGDEGGDRAATWWLKRLSDSYRWTPSHGDVNAMWLKDRQGLVDACMAGFIPRNPCRVCEVASIDEDTYGRPWCAEHFPKMIENEADLELYCYECGDDLDSFDVYGRAWCAVHKPFAVPSNGSMFNEALPDASIQVNPTTSTDEYTTNLDKPQQEQPTEVPNIPIPAPPRPRHEKPKTAMQCSADGCYGIVCGHDMLGGQWCGNCQLRRELVDSLFAHGFPRIEYSPCHFIEAGEEAAKGFARAMSAVAVSLAVREVARVGALVIQGSS